MADFIERISPLDKIMYPGRFGAEADEPGVTFSDRLPASLVQVSCWPDSQKKIIAVLNKHFGLTLNPGQLVTTKGETFVMPTGPGRWMVESQDEDEEEKLRALIKPEWGSVTGLSHARVIITVSGEKAAWLLATGIALDFHVDAFPVGAVRMTHHHEIGLLVHRKSLTEFDLYAFTSFARGLWHWLSVAAGEVGYRVI